MELRDLEYFLSIAREENITAAAKSLHLSQPALTRQLKMLEDEFGKQLVIRGSRKITLTEEGMLLRKRAEEILILAQRTQKEIRSSDTEISGDIYICAVQTDGVRFIADTAKKLRDRYHNIRFHLSSGDSSDVLEELEKGLIDFGVLFAYVDISKYNSIPVPYNGTLGILMRKDSELAQKKTIAIGELLHQPIILPRNTYNNSVAMNYLLNISLNKIEVSATYNHVFNAAIMVEAGLGYAVCLDGLINLTGDTRLCFCPLEPQLKAVMNIVWKKHKVMSRCANAFLSMLKEC